MTPAAAAAADPAPIFMAPSTLPSISKPMIFGSRTLGSLTSVPSASASGAHASITKIVPAGNFLVGTGMTAMPRGPVSPVTSFSLSIQRAVGLYGELADVATLMRPVQALVGHAEFRRVRNEDELPVCAEYGALRIVEGIEPLHHLALHGVGLQGV